MDKQYEMFCLADRFFYDLPTQPSDTSRDYPAAARPLPAGWRSGVSGEWLSFRLEGAAFPAQGWKIHVSATLDNAERVLDRVWDYCVSHGVAFKFLRSRRALLLRNSKYADRGGSGKFITVYPADEAELEILLKELDERLRGEPGPYVLSDLRWADGPLHVRYGGFELRYCTDESGRLVEAIEAPDGRLVPDRRGPVFKPPEWVTLPSCLEPHLAARNTMVTGELPYRIEKALHFSNGGGVYLARDTRTGEQVVLKEGRPYAGLVGDGADAVTRLRRERDVLRHLSGTGVGPEVRDSFVFGGHEFLVLEYIDGRPLNNCFGERYPLLVPQADRQERAAYTEWALKIQAGAEQAVRTIHEHGIVFNDLHLFNIMVRPDDSVTLIDFEVAAPPEQSERQRLASPAFQAPPDRSGFDIDLYALACLRLALFLPLTMLLQLDRRKAAQFAEVIAAEFPDVPRSFLDEAVHRIVGNSSAAAPAALPGSHPVVDPGDWPSVRDSLAGTIVRAATPQREDRLYPGDVRQFDHPGGGLGLAHGAAGVLYALAVTGADRCPEHEEWLIRRSARPLRGTRPGLYDGLHGVAHTLELLGHREEALHTLELCLAERWERLGTDLRGGLSGHALNLLHFARTTGDTALHDHALRAAGLVADRLGGPDDVPTTSGGAHPRAGLMLGPSGPALMFLHLYEESGDTAWLDLAETGLRQDLRRCTAATRDGSLQVDERWRTMPYVAEGSAGIGLVLGRFLTHRPGDPGLVEAAAAIRRAAYSPFYVQSGLFAGRAGLILLLAADRHSGQQDSNQQGSGGREARPGPELAAQLTRLSWHALRHQDSLVFPGDQLYRLSLDLATGSAGVLLALGAALHDAPVHLPFLGPAPRAATAAH